MHPTAMRTTSVIRMCAVRLRAVSHFFWAPLSSFARLSLLDNHFGENFYGPPGRVLEGNGVLEKNESRNGVWFPGAGADWVGTCPSHDINFLFIFARKRGL